MCSRSRSPASANARTCCRATSRLSTHIDDVVNLIVCEELSDVVLVGHSYGGLPITGAADRLLARHAGRAASTWSTSMPSCRTQARAGRRTMRRSWSRSALAESAAHPQGALPPPDAALYGLTGADCEWVNRRQTPHPFGQYREPLPFDAARLAALPRTFIDCTSPAWPSIAPMRQRVRNEPGWRVRELATGHDAMVSAPGPLARLLLEAAA